MSNSVNYPIIIHAEFFADVGDDSEPSVPLIHRHIVRIEITEAAYAPAGDCVIIHPPNGMLGGFMFVTSNGTTSCFDL